MPEHESVYDFLTGRQFVELGARLQGVDDLDGGRHARDRDRRPRRRAGPHAARATRAGMRQRMRLAATLVHDPPLLAARRAALGHRPGAAPAPARRDPRLARGGPDDPRLVAHPRGGRPARRPHPPDGQRQARRERRLPRDPAAAERPAVRRPHRLRPTPARWPPGCSRSRRSSPSRSTGDGAPARPQPQRHVAPAVAPGRRARRSTSGCCASSRSTTRSRASSSTWPRGAAA